MAKLKTREKILKAAEELFSKNGYDGVPTKLIASEAGVTEMTLFNHFKNKELLYNNIVKERYLTIEIESIFSELSYDKLEQDLKRISVKLIENFVENRKLLLMRLKEKQNFHNDEVFSIENDPLLKQITPVFISYAKNGLINQPGENAARLFIVAFKGICHICLLEDKSEEYITLLINNYVSTICNGMKT